MSLITQGSDDLEVLAADASMLRERLLANARALALYGLIDDGQLEQLRGANGYKNVAQDLQILSMVLGDAWPRIQGKIAATPEDLGLANRMATRLMRVVGIREQGPPQLAAAAELRMRAFALVLRAYEENTRRAVGYLRAREGDADSIAPTLYPNRPPRRRSTEAQAPAPAVAGGPAAAAPVAAAPAAAAPVAAPAALGGLAPAPSALVSSKGPFLS